MPACYPEDVVAYARSQKGTKEGKNNWNPYAQMLDAVNYFYPQKKQNEPWCCTYVDACVFVASGKDKAKADAVLYQPAKENYSAVVKYLAGYFKNKGKYFTDKDKVEIGDVIFFNAVNDKGQVTSTFSHTGIVIDRDDRGVTTSEGNKHDKVSECQYLFTSIGTKIAGFGKPNYDKKPEPQPEPPAPTPTADKYKVVNIRTFLSIRSTPEVKSDDSNKVGELYNDTIVTVIETSNGWAKITGDCWVSLKYLKKL